MTTKEAIKHLSDKIDYAEQCDDKWVDSVSIKALYVAVRAMAEERKNGKWLDGEDPSCFGWDAFIQCSVCGYKRKWDGEIFDFCPSCGADMRGEKDA